MIILNDPKKDNYPILNYCIELPLFIGNEK